MAAAQAQLPRGQEKLLQLVWILFCSSTKKEESPCVAGAEKAESSMGRCKDAWRAEQHGTASFPELSATGLHYPLKRANDLLA